MSYAGPTRRLVSQDDAAMIARPDVPRSKFDGSFSVKTTFDQGLLIPFHIDEVYPGDHLAYDFVPFIRTATPFFPIMDSLRVDIHAFFVPNRIIWSNWVKLMGEQVSPGDTIAYSVPQVTSTGNGFAIGSIFDHLGLPTVGQPTTTLSVSQLPARAYNAIYDAWYRDENLINSAGLYVDDTNRAESLFPVRRRAKSHDYFTSCLPWPQKFVAPTVPLGGKAPIEGIGWNGATAPTAGPAGPYNETPPFGTSPNPFPQDTYTSGFWATTSAVASALRVNVMYNGVQYAPLIYADLSAATGVDINTFRQAMQVQVFLERMARGGTRYTEITENIFGVRNPDARLQRPEYIGGGSTPVNFTPVAQTSPVAGVGVGQLGAAGTAVGNNRASYAATEHGLIVCIMSVKAELSYSQGIHKFWDRKTLYDFYNPAFAGLGEQAVKRREIFATGDSANDDVVFGYQERWHELRTVYSRVSGLFRPTAAGNIDEWHLGQQFSPAPTLGQTFIEDSAPMSRVLAAGASTNQQFIADVHIRRSATRPVPMFGTPVGLGRF